MMMYLWRTSLFGAITNMGKCIVAIVEDLLVLLLEFLQTRYLRNLWMPSFHRFWTMQFGATVDEIPCLEGR